jgi:hypothetical protein
MRKVLSFVLVLSLVLGSFGMAFAAPLSDVAGEDFEDAVNVLTELGVVNGYPDGTFRPDNIVTRAEMAVIVVSALGLADYATGTSNFSDMAGHWSNPYVAYATSLGVISGYPDGTFKPDKTVSYDEAATMLVAALGYNADSLVGTWPANFVTKAKTLGILDGIKAGAAGANRGDIAIMTYQTLDQTIGKTDKDGAWNPTVLKVDNTTSPATYTYDNMLERLGASEKAGGAFVLTDTDAEEAVANVREYIGAYVTAYVNDEDKIIAIKEVKSTFLTGEFDKNFTAGGAWPANTVFETDDQDYDLEIASLTYTNGIDDFRNGETGALTDGVPKAGVTYKIAADVSGKKIKDIYSVSVWTVTDSFLFEDDMLDDDNINGNNFTLDDNDEIDLSSFALLGVSSLEEIDEDNVVYVYSAGSPLEITRIEVGTEVVTGEVTKINASGSKVTVGGKTYELSDESADVAEWNGLELEDEVEFYLDYAGKVYAVEAIESEGDNYAMVLEVENDSSGLSGSDASVKLFLADGTTKIFKMDGDFKDADASIFNEGTWINGGRFLGGATPTKATTTILVEYGLNEEGVVDYIDEVAPLVGPTAATTELTSKGYYNGKIVASDAILFTYDGTNDALHASDDDYYGVTTVAKASGKEFAAEYFIESNKITVMVTAGLGSGSDEVYGLAVSRGKTTDSSTDYMVTMLVDGKKVDYPIVKTEYDKFPGTYNYLTLYEISTNAKDEITALKDITVDANADTAFLGGTGLTTNVKATGFSGSVVTLLPGGDVTIDRDAVAYMFNADDSVYVASSVSKSNLVGRYVKLIDLDGDSVADVVMITKTDATAEGAANQAAVNAVAAGIDDQSFTGAAGTVKLPAVPAGYTIVVKTSDTLGVYDADGKILTDGTSNVVYTVTHTDSAKTADTVSVVVNVDVD